MKIHGGGGLTKTRMVFVNKWPYVLGSITVDNGNFLRFLLNFEEIWYEFLLWLIVMEPKFSNGTEQLQWLFSTLYLFITGLDNKTFFLVCY